MFILHILFEFFIDVFVKVLFSSLESLFGEQRRQESGVRSNESLKANFHLLPLKLKFTVQPVSRQPGMP